MQALQVVQAHAASSFSANSSNGLGLSLPAANFGKIPADLKEVQQVAKALADG